MYISFFGIIQLIISPDMNDAKIKKYGTIVMVICRKLSGLELELHEEKFNNS